MARPIPEFYPGYTEVWGNGNVPRTTEGVQMREPGPRYRVGAGTAEDPSIYYMYDIDTCRFLTKPRRPYFEEELRQLAIKSNMKCLIVRLGPHNWKSKRTVSGTIVTTKLNRGHYVTDMEPAEWHITIFMGEHFDNVYVQGHVYTCLAPNPYDEDPPKILKFMDDPQNQRTDGLNIGMELWLVGRSIRYRNHRR